MAGPFQLCAAGPQQGDRGALLAAGLLHGLMDFQHYRSHGLTEVRVRLRAAAVLALHLSLVWVGFGGTAVLGSWHWRLAEPQAGCSGWRPGLLEFNASPASAQWELAWPRAGLYMGSTGA